MTRQFWDLCQELYKNWFRNGACIALFKKCNYDWDSETFVQNYFEKNFNCIFLNNYHKYVKMFHFHNLTTNVHNIYPTFAPSFYFWPPILRYLYFTSEKHKNRKLIFYLCNSKAQIGRVWLKTSNKNIFRFNNKSPTTKRVIKTEQKSPVFPRVKLRLILIENFSPLLGFEPSRWIN